MTINFGRQARIISVASGKGGVGKTSVATNLSVALARAGHRTLIADCDFGMANAAILLGLNPPTTIDDVLDGTCGIEEVLIAGPEGLMVLPGGSGTGLMPDFGTIARQRLAEGLRPFARLTDYMIIDTASGGAPSTLETIAAADLIVLTLSNEPTAFMDAYATIKMLTVNHGCTHFSIVANMVDTEAEGRALFGRFSDVVRRFLSSELDFLGSIPNDRHMRDAVLHKRCCVDAYPHSPAAFAFARMARRITDRGIPLSSGGNRFMGQELTHVLR